MRSYRRILLDRDLEDAKRYMKGVALDIGGGRKRGNFREPSDARWVVLDSSRELRPHILGDAQEIPVKSSSVDCVKCTELLEHVEYPEKVLHEISQVLRPGGTLILSTPFNSEIHGDPHDFQRLTDQKLARMLEGDFQIQTMKKQGLYFTVLAHMLRQGILHSKRVMRLVLTPLLPVLDLLVKLDNLASVRNSEYMTSFTMGFFIIAVKKG